MTKKRINFKFPFLFLFLFLLFLFSILILPSVSAQHPMKGHMKLLAVNEGGKDDGNGIVQQGSIADLYLEIKPGLGSVYIDTFPLTKMDTQLSTRFAKEIACKFLNKDCKKYDFFYTIKADSSIIGGPSAGAALAMLTVALLDEDVKKIDETVTITGTINTGGIIGSVGGVKEKIEAASKNNITKVLIPKGSSFTFKLNETKVNETINIINESIPFADNGIINKTILNISKENVSDKINLIEYGLQLKIEVIEVFTLADAMKEFTGKSYETPEGDIDLVDFYTTTMGSITENICNRTTELSERLNKSIIDKEGIFDEQDLFGNATSPENIIYSNIIYSSLYNRTQELINLSKISLENNEFYPAASYCFGANINLDYLILINANISAQQKAVKLEELLTAINNSNQILDNMSLTSLNDLQTYLIVKERLVEAYDSLEKATELMNKNQTDVEYEIAYTTERLYSAYSWSYFFNASTASKEQAIQQVILDEQVLQDSCKMTLGEAQERLEYFKILYPYPFPFLETTTTELERAYEQFNANQFKMCLMHASKAKSEIDAVLSTVNLEDEQLEELLNVKLELVKQVILKQQMNGLFPIEGYSYYEYAKALSKNDKISGLIYSQYALEFSNLDLYFNIVEEKTGTEKLIFFIEETLGVKVIVAFFIGLGAGIIVCLLIFLIRKVRKQEPQHIYTEKITTKPMIKSITNIKSVTKLKTKNSKKKF